jgi:hypothetical protein
MNFPQRCRLFRYVLLILLACFSPILPLLAQDATRGGTGKEEPPKASVTKQKVLIIPFDLKMYMSDIDRSINRDTKMTFPQIRSSFRSGIDNQLVSAFKPKYTVISLLRDSVKCRGDLAFIYRSIGYKYTVTTGKETAVQQKSINNGQLTVPIKGEEERYMQTAINQPGLLEAMNKKYGAELFVFVSEVDLKSASSSDPVPMREASVHFTVYDLQGKMVGGGLAKSKFDPDLNEPQRIVSRVFSQVAEAIFTRSAPPPPPKPTVQVPQKKN